MRADDFTDFAKLPRIILVVATTWTLLVCSGGDAAEPPDQAERESHAERRSGYVVDGASGADAPAGRWSHGRPVAASKVAPWQEEQMVQLRALGYVSGSRKAQGEGGVRLAKEGRLDGYNFYVSGHAPVAVLMDMEGRILHRWRLDFETAWPQRSQALDPVHSSFWRRAYLYENGDVLAIFEGLGMIKIDRHSRLIWKSRRREHHDLEVMDNGDIYVLTRKRHIVPRVNESKPIIEDFITQLDRNGRVEREISLLECLESSPYANLWNRDRRNKGDIFHTNTLAVLDQTLQEAPEFQAGRVLTSFLRLDVVALVDLEEQEVVWAHRGDFRAQHDPQVVASGSAPRLMVFDNRGGEERRGGSRILLYDLPRMTLSWVYEGSTADPFYTHTCGAAQRLSNGNTLITETDNGRALEVDRRGRKVWEFRSPHRAGPKRELVASLFEMQRISPSRVRWLSTGQPGQTAAE